MPVRRSVPLVLLLALLAGCGSDVPTGPTVGEMMTVAEQLAIPGAMEKVATALEATGQPADSNLAGFTRIAAQLVGRSGVQGTVLASNSRLQAVDTMHAVAGLVTQGSLQLHYVLAWSGLDATKFTVQRAFALLVDGNGKTTGSFSLAGPSTTATARYVELPASVIFNNTAGTLDVSDTSFTDDCAETPSQADVTCRSGGENVGMSFTGATGAGESVALSWDAVALPSYHLTSAAVLGLSRRGEQP
jgi:hypothetical protein